MYEQVEKSKENTSPDSMQESKAAANFTTQKKRKNKLGFRFCDNRTETVTQRHIQNIIQNSDQNKPVFQLQMVDKKHFAATTSEKKIKPIHTKTIQRIPIRLGGFGNVPGMVPGMVPAMGPMGPVMVPGMVPGVVPGPQSAALDNVLNNLSRIAQQILQYYDNDPQTDLIFRTNNTGDLGETSYFVNINGNWEDIDDICDPNSANYALGLNIAHNSPVRVIISIDPAAHGPTNVIAATLSHEITVHAIHMQPWLRNLRSRAYNGVQIRARWRRANAQGALLDVEAEHSNWATGFNRAYNRSVSNIWNNMAPGAARDAFRNDVRADMREHYRDHVQNTTGIRPTAVAAHNFLLNLVGQQRYPI